MKTKNKTFVILQINRNTSEVIIFGEIKCKSGDANALHYKLNDIYHTYRLEEKVYFNNNKENILNEFITTIK